MAIDAIATNDVTVSGIVEFRRGWPEFRQRAANPGVCPELSQNAVEDLEVLTMGSGVRVLMLTVLMHAAFGASEPANALCLPSTTRFTKCIDGKVSECTRERGLSCKKKFSCRVTGDTCSLSDVVR